MSKDGIHELLDERSVSYQNAWLKTGWMAKQVSAEIASLLFHFPDGWWSWVVILNKLVRILGDPEHLDSWKDIVGYATLVVDRLEGEKRVRT